MKEPKQYTIETRKSDRTPSVVTRDLAGLIQYFSYTLEIGNSWNNKIPRYPKTIKAFVKALQMSYEEKEASCFQRTSVKLLEAETSN